MGESRAGISEDTVEVIALLLVNIGWVGMSEDAVQVIALILVNIVWVDLSEDLSRLLHQHWWILLEIGISEDTVKVIALILVNIFRGWDIRGHCQDYCTDIGEYCPELEYQRTLSRLLHWYWWIFSGVGISEDTVILNIVQGWDTRVHCQGYYTDIGEYCPSLGYQRKL